MHYLQLLIFVLISLCLHTNLVAASAVSQTPYNNTQLAPKTTQQQYEEVKQKKRKQKKKKKKKWYKALKSGIINFFDSLIDLPRQLFGFLVLVALYYLIIKPLILLIGALCTAIYEALFG